MDEFKVGDKVRISNCGVDSLFDESFRGAAGVVIKAKEVDRNGKKHQILLVNTPRGNVAPWDDECVKLPK